MKTTYKYIEFVWVSGRWICRNRKSRLVICETEYVDYDGLGQWVTSYTDSDAIFSHECHTDIAHFLQQLNEEKK